MSEKRKKSGAENRRVAKKFAEESALSAKTMQKWLNKVSGPKPGSSIETAQAERVTYESMVAVGELPTPSDVASLCKESGFTLQGISHVQHEPEEVRSSLSSEILIDISSWPANINKTLRDAILAQGPQKRFPPFFEYPKDGENRHFSNAYFKRTMVNGESFDRSWLIYSERVNKVYCFSCKLFNVEGMQLSSVGICDWRHLSKRLKSHESNREHMKSFSTWLEATSRLKTLSGIDSKLQGQIMDEKRRWQNVFKRLIDITLYLAERNLAFRGSANKLYAPGNGNFLGLVQLLSKYDDVLKEHIRKVKCHETHLHYCGNLIQNEIISLIGKEVRNTIINKIKKSKYFSVILDCTPDASHQEQMSFTFRYVDTSSETVSLCESFVNFTAVDDTTGEGLSELFIEEMVQTYGIDMQDCRGQGYDNGANMAGIRKGVQQRIINQYPRAFFNPCGCHSLNLVVSDAVKSTVKSVSLFGFIQKIFVLFAGSTKRWAVISSHTSNLTLKKVCETRWESRIKSLKPIRYQYKEVHEALCELHESSNDPVTEAEALALAEKMEDFDFIVTFVAWHDLLEKINFISKAMQGISMDLPQVTALIENCIEFCKQFRETGFDKCKEIATEMACACGFAPKFSEKRIRKKKKMFPYEGQDDVSSDPEELYRSGTFYVMVDTILQSLESRFEQLKNHGKMWQFLYDIVLIKDEKTLLQHCADLQEHLRDGESESDIDGAELCNEILNYRILTNHETSKPMDVLQQIKKCNWQDMLPNLWIALRILLTIPVTVASGERSFSKLNLIKTYLRSTMGQQRLSDLAIIAIENEIASSVSYADVITAFAESKARKINL